MTILSRHNRTTKEELLVDETIFSIANGYIGTRGTFTEGYGTNYEYPQTLLNGLYDYYDYHYEENLTGFPQKGQKIMNLLDGTRIDFMIDGVPINPTKAKIISLKREYDLQKGMTIRTVTYRMNDNEFTIVEKRIVSQKHRFVISTNIHLSSPTYTGDIHIRSYLKEPQKPHQTNVDPRLHSSNERHLIIDDKDVEESVVYYHTSRSNLHVASSMVHNLSLEPSEYRGGLMSTGIISLQPKHPLILTKHIIHTSDLYDEDYVDRMKKLKQNFMKFSFSVLSKTEEEQSTLFWNDTQIEIPNNKEIESLLHYNMFQLNRQGGEHYLHNIAAKGLSGEGYEGHYFWDTEIYMIPFFTLTNPNKAKQLLLYRYHKIEEARIEAQNLGYSTGIKIPWRTINGAEVSPYYPAGSAQFHINSDVAYAVIKYVEATGDHMFLFDYGFELLVETARLLVEAVNYEDGRYHLNCVTGPDEYTTVVNDNFYTNVMLQYHLRKTVEYYEGYRSKLEDSCVKINVTNDEIHHFEDISKHMALPYDETLGIFKQDQSFLQKKRLDLSEIPRTKFPLLLNYHPLFLYKHQVLKQADTMLGLMLLDEFDEDVVRRSYEYYEPITTHDSSLSKCIYSICAFQLNLMEQAERYFRLVLETDVNNIHNNTKDGLHVANLGGSYLGFLYGLVGLRIHEDHIKIHPRVTNEIDSYKVQFLYQGNTVSIEVSDTVTVSTTGPILIDINGEKRSIETTYETVLST